MELMFVSDLEMLKFDKNDLVPMIIQDVNSGVVLSLFYANKESIKKMQETGFVWRYSRKNKKVMMKGEESGNSQKVVSVSLDCDNDALLVKIIPNGPACHKGTVSCFESEVSTTLSEFAFLVELVETIKK